MLPPPLSDVYAVLGTLRDDALCRVYRVRDRTHHRPFILHLLALPEVQDEDSGALFASAIDTLRSVRHAHLAPLVEAGTAQGQPFMVWADEGGQRLDERLSVHGALPLHAVVRLGDDLASALAALHRQGLVHRDVQPARIVHRPDGSFALADAGPVLRQDLGRATDGLEPALDHFSPEQIDGRAVHQSDQYAWGAVLFEAATGQKLFGVTPSRRRGSAHVQLAHLILHVPPPRLHRLRADVPVWLDEYVARALHKEADQRFASMEALRDAWRAAAAAELPAPECEPARTPMSHSATVLAVPPVGEAASAPPPVLASSVASMAEPEPLATPLAAPLSDPAPLPEPAPLSEPAPLAAPQAEEPVAAATRLPLPLPDPEPLPRPEPVAAFALPEPVTTPDAVWAEDPPPIAPPSSRNAGRQDAPRARAPRRSVPTLGAAVALTALVFGTLAVVLSQREAPEPAPARAETERVDAAPPAPQRSVTQASTPLQPQASAAPEAAVPSDPWRGDVQVAGLSKAALDRLVDAYLDHAAQNPRRVLDRFAEAVTYFGQRGVARRVVVEDKERYLDRWPTRDYTRTSEVDVSRRADGVQLRFRYRYALRNATTATQGDGWTELTLRDQGGRFSIVGENGGVL